MKKNFVVGQGNEIILKNEVFDLHNCYDFSEIILKNNNCIQLWFKSNTQHKSDANYLMLEIQKINFLEISNGVMLGSICDVDEIGYKSPQDNNLDWLISEGNATGDDHLVFRFGLDDYIRLHGARAEFYKKKERN